MSPGQGKRKRQRCCSVVVRLFPNLLPFSLKPLMLSPSGKCPLRRLPCVCCCRCCLWTSVLFPDRDGKGKPEVLLIARRTATGACDGELAEENFSAILVFVFGRV